MPYLLPRSFILPAALMTFMLLPVVSVAQWVEDGVPICVEPGDQGESVAWPQPVSDGAGGAIIAWPDMRADPENDVYAQRVDSDGFVLWTMDGVEICTMEGWSNLVQLIPDGAGGAIITWDDSRNGYENYDVFAQRISASGVVQWTVDGIAVSTALMDQSHPVIAPMGAGGAVIVWRDYRSENDLDLYAQCVDADGQTLWPEDGVAVCTAAERQDLPQAINTGFGEVIVLWLDERNETTAIYAQKVDADGNMMWAENGVPVCGA